MCGKGIERYSNMFYCALVVLYAISVYCAQQVPVLELQFPEHIAVYTLEEGILGRRCLYTPIYFVEMRERKILHKSQKNLCYNNTIFICRVSHITFTLLILSNIVYLLLKLMKKKIFHSNAQLIREKKRCKDKK